MSSAPASRLTPVLALIVLAQLSVTLPLASGLNVWVDEAYTLHTTEAGPADASGRALRFEMQPPAYFAALSVWRGVDRSAFFARLFSVTCVALAVPVIAWTAQRFFPGLHPGWVAAAVAFSPGALWAAVEARPYALALLLAASLLGCFEAGFLAAAPRRSFRVAYAVLALVALHTQYYLGFLLAANGVALLALRGRRALGTYAVWMLPVAAGFAPVLGLVPEQVTAHTATSERAALARSLVSPLVNFEILAFGIERLPGGRAARWVYRGVVLSLLLLAIRSAWAERRRPSLAAQSLLVSLVVLGLCFAALPAVYGHWAALARHTIALLPVGLLVLYGGLAAGRSRLPLGGAMLLLLVGDGFILRDEWLAMAKQGDHVRVAREIERLEALGQPILVFPSEQALALEFHYAGRNRIVPLPTPASLVRFDPRTFAWRGPEHVRAVLRDALGARTECWLLTYGVEESLDYPLSGELLEDEVAARFRTLARREFHGGVTLRLLSTLDAAPAAEAASPEAARRHSTR